MRGKGEGECRSWCIGAALAAAEFVSVAGLVSKQTQLNRVKAIYEIICKKFSTF